MKTCSEKKSALQRPENGALPLMDRTLIKEGDRRAVLYAPDGTNISFIFQARIICSNNEAEYEAQIIPLNSALQM